ncbi:MAG: hypothetical protein KC506_01240 [Nanoarchaeota archaeon]|nr:hypothetical protein [Nanoarchaeota archaeon]
MINKKAQIEKALTFPVFILIIITMTAFLILASIISLGSPIKSEQADSSSNSKSENLFTEIKIPLEDKELNILAYDLIQIQTNNLIEPTKVQNALANSLNEKNNCYLYYSSADVNEKVITELGKIRNSDGTLTSISDIKKIQYDKTKLIETSRYSDPITISHYLYLGGCELA